MEDPPESLKKRQRRPETYKRFLIKNLKVKGLAHTNWKAKAVPPRATGTNCECKMACFEQLTQDDFEFCINKMNTFLSKNEQDVFLQQLIEKISVKTHRPRKEGAEPREYAFKYFVFPESENKMYVKKRLSLFMALPKTVVDVFATYLMDQKLLVTNEVNILRVIRLLLKFYKQYMIIFLIFPENEHIIRAKM